MSQVRIRADERSAEEIERQTGLDPTSPGLFISIHGEKIWSNSRRDSGRFETGEQMKTRAAIVRRLEKIDREIDEADRIYWSDFQDTKRKRDAHWLLGELVAERKDLRASLVRYDEDAA